MKKTILLVLVLARGMVPMSLAAEGTWTTKCPMPTATSLHSASVVQGKIYVIGGTDNLYGWADYWSTVFVYDPATDTWAKKADMPSGRARLSTSVVDGKIYAIGGSPHRDAEVPTVEVYDPATDSWTRETDLPRARNWHSTSVVNGKIYAIGGKIYPSATMVSSVEEYDPATDTWTRKAEMPTARAMHSASVVEGKIYVIGGVASEGGGGPGLSTVEAYDPATDTWTTKADMPTPRKALSSSVVNGRIYAIGGTTGWAPCFSTVEAYDPATDSWTREADMPTARGCHSASVVDGKIYAIGGVLNPSGWQPCLATVEVYDPNPLVVDFNGDGAVDCIDICIMVDHWHEEYSPCDIGPMPGGDGVVDVQDLIVLAEHIGKEVDDPTLAAHWALDETEGLIAYDSAGANDGTVMGAAAWRPYGGQVDGALAFDGTAFVVADFVLSPSDGPFSVLAWVKGSAPGQVIVSQQGGANWLMTDPSTGALMTELQGGRPWTPLYSDAIITDSTWHRIGFTWDGTSRRLHVDGGLIAEGTQAALESSAGKQLIGCGANMSPDTFWSGLIDDVRIYNRAVKP